MDLFLAIALLCNVGTSSRGFYPLEDAGRYHLACQQSLLHCVNVKSYNKHTKEEALNICLMERKIK